MPKKPLEAIEEHFSKVNDPRIDRGKEHKLIDMIVIAICAVICGAEGWTDIENFWNSKLPWLKTFLELPNGIPSHDTFGRVFSMLDAQQFQLAFYEWVMAANEIVQGQIINIDGKRLAFVILQPCGFPILNLAPGGVSRKRTFSRIHGFERTRPLVSASPCGVRL